MTKISDLLKRFFHPNVETKADNQVSDIHSIISQLKIDSQKHTNVGPVLTPQEIQEIESRLGLKLSPSYRLFLQEFGDGAYWLYGRQPMDSIRKPVWFIDIHPQAQEVLSTDHGESVRTDKLLCLMSEDSNSGSWCWITSRPDAEGEFPLAYYGFAEEGILSEGGLFYELSGFKVWLNLLSINKDEVIRVLDRDGKLILG